MLTATADKLCRVCGHGFVPFLSTQVVCGVRCAVKVPKLARKAYKQKTRERIEQLRPLSYWTKQAQVSFNTWIRMRDESKPCISCNDALVGERKFMAGQYDAGHYLTTGARPELRFDEANVHKQCKQCNQHLHGNTVRFRVGLLARIGVAELERLEGHHEPRRLRAEDLKAIRDDYRARLKAMRQEA